MNPQDLQTIGHYFRHGNADWDLSGRNANVVRAIARTTMAHRLIDQNIDREPTVREVDQVVEEFNTPFPGHIRRFTLYVPNYALYAEARNSEFRPIRRDYALNYDARPLDIYGALYTDIMDQGGLKMMGDFTGFVSLGPWPEVNPDGLAPSYDS